MYIFSGTPSRDRRIKRDSGLARPFLFLQKNICFAVQIPRKLDIYDLHEGLVINVSLKEFRGICERDYPKIEAYLGLKKYLLRTFGVTLNIHSQKTKGDFDKNTDEP